MVGARWEDSEEILGGNYGQCKGGGGAVDGGEDGIASWLREGGKGGGEGERVCEERTRARGQRRRLVPTFRKLQRACRKRLRLATCSTTSEAITQSNCLPPSSLL